MPSTVPGYKTVKQRIVNSNGDYELVSMWTHSDTIELPDGQPLTNKVNRGVYIDTKEIDDMLIEPPAIDDYDVSPNKLWSSQKINNELENKATLDDTSLTTDATWSAYKINNALSTKGTIDDSITTTSSTWSSSKIGGLLATKAEINDSFLSSTSTYSSQKIENLIATSTGAIDDTKTDTTHTWSSSKINTQINTQVATKASINDNTPSSSTTYSGTKIEALYAKTNRSVGDSNHPVYFVNGVPTVCGTYIRSNSIDGHTGGTTWPADNVPVETLIIVGKNVGGTSKYVVAFIDYAGNVVYIHQDNTVATVSYNKDTKYAYIKNAMDTQKVSVLLLGTTRSV